MNWGLSGIHRLILVQTKNTGKQYLGLSGRGAPLFLSFSVSSASQVL